jgi:LysR family glycine cleavage system transcriptional activator
VTVSVLPALATNWLIPRMRRFHELRPDVDLDVRTSSLLADLSQDGLDMAVRYGPGHWEGLTAERLLEERLFPVCAPSLRDHCSFLSPADLLRARLLRDHRVPWSLWFEAVGLDGNGAADLGPIFNDAGLLLEAAAEGLGVALARSVLVERHLATGRLVSLFETAVPAEFAYYVAQSSGRELRPPAAAFREWLLREATVLADAEA